MRGSMCRLMVSALALLLSALVPATASAQETLNGLMRVGDWTDFENSAGDMPATVWGNCDELQADAVGIRVDFNDGTSGTATYSNLADKWNTDHDFEEGFPGLIVGPATGFLASCPFLHYLYNDGINLPMAWHDCSMAFAGNFDLDYDESGGSNFRADQAGWVSARFQTYCGQLAVTTSAAPALSTWGLIAATLALGAVGRWRLSLRDRL